VVAAAHLIPRTACTRWDQLEGHDVPSWIVWLLGLYSDAYASNQYRALQQFFMRRAEEEELPRPKGVARWRLGSLQQRVRVHRSRRRAGPRRSRSSR
jgi:hypothetical protein